jgi:hypothetical protein
MTAGLLHLVDRPDIVEDLRARHNQVNGNDPRITPVGPTIFLEAAEEIERLRGMLEVQDEMVKHYIQERDSARQTICVMESECIVDPPTTPQQYAHRMQWDCFKENA